MSIVSNSLKKNDLITIDNLKSKEKYQKEYKEKFDWELYSFPNENQYFDSVIVYDLKFKRINFPCALFDEINYILSTNYYFRLNGSFKDVESIYYSLVTSSSESKEVMQIYFIKMKSRKGAKDLYGLFNQKIFGKNARALQKGKLIIIGTGKTCRTISYKFFSSLAKKMIFCRLSPLYE